MFSDQAPLVSVQKLFFANHRLNSILCQIESTNFFNSYVPDVVSSAIVVSFPSVRSRKKLTSVLNLVLLFLPKWSGSLVVSSEIRICKISCCYILVMMIVPSHQRATPVIHVLKTSITNDSFGLVSPSKHGGGARAASADHAVTVSPVSVSSWGLPCNSHWREDRTRPSLEQLRIVNPRHRT